MKVTLRMARLSAAGLALAIAGLGAAPPSHAAQTFERYEFSADTPGPTASHSGSFSFLYDDETFTPTLLEIDYAIGGTVFTTANAAMSSQTTPAGYVHLFLFGKQSGYVLYPAVDDFILTFRIQGPPGYKSFAYTQAEADDVVFNAYDQFALEKVAVPEPGTWALMILGFGLTGAAVRRRHALPA